MLCRIENHLNRHSTIDLIIDEQTPFVGNFRLSGGWGILLWVVFIDSGSGIVALNLPYIVRNHISFRCCPHEIHCLIWIRSGDCHTIGRSSRGVRQVLIVLQAKVPLFIFSSHWLSNFTRRSAKYLFAGWFKPGSSLKTGLFTIRLKPYSPLIH